MVFANLAWMKNRWHTFPEPFRQGMAARAQMLGDTGVNHPDNWEDKMASEDLHAVVILFARDQEETGTLYKKAPGIPEDNRRV